MPKIIEPIFFVLSDEKHKEYHEKLKTRLSKISRILRKFGIFFNEKMVFFLINSNDLTIQNEGLQLLKFYSETGNFRTQEELLTNLREKLEDLLSQTKDFNETIDLKDMTFLSVSSSLQKQLATRNLNLLIFCSNKRLNS